MHICIVGSSKRFFSGISAYTIVMANAFAESKHKVSVILLRNLVPLFLYPGRDRVGKGKYVIEFRPEIDVYDGMDWNSPISWTNACGFIMRNKPDAIIVHWWTSSVAHMQLLLVLAKHINRMKTRLILEMHEVVDPLEEKILPIRLYSRVAGRILVNLCDAYIAHSDEAREAIAKAYNLPEDKIHVIPHGPYNIYGFSDREMTRRQLQLNGFTILYFGMIRKYKGVPLLIKAFNELPMNVANSMHLIIAGEDWGDDQELLLALNNSPYRDRILFKPEFIPDDMVPKYFAVADVVVLPYLRTCGSGVVNIAKAQGKPIVTSDLETMVECLAEYEGASFFPTGNIQALSAKIVEAYNGWQISETKTYNNPGATWNDIIQKYEQIDERMANSKCV